MFLGRSSCSCTNRSPGPWCWRSVDRSWFSVHPNRLAQSARRPHLIRRSICARKRHAATERRASRSHTWSGPRCRWVFGGTRPRVTSRTRCCSCWGSTSGDPTNRNRSRPRIKSNHKKQTHLNILFQLNIIMVKKNDYHIMKPLSSIDLLGMHLTLTNKFPVRKASMTSWSKNGEIVFCKNKSVKRYIIFL